MTNHAWHVAVLIPARDEEELLVRCLRSVLISADRLRDSVRSDIIVVSDSSTDGTAKIAAQLLGSKAVVNAQVASAGKARRLAADFFLRRYRGSVKKLWLANTDADCVVPPGWLADQIELAELGIEAMAGTVSVDSFREHGREMRERFRSSYTIHQDGTHPHVHGANLGVRGDVYLRAGGWADLDTAEDHDLWKRLLRAGARVISTAEIEVKTSGRQVGRAPHGFAGALAALNKAAIPA